MLILANGVFAAAEIALVSLRDGQVRALAGQSKRGRTVAELNEDPNRFLSAVQVGVTLMGFLSAAFGGATLADDLAPVLTSWGLPEGASAAAAVLLAGLPAIRETPVTGSPRAPLCLMGVCFDCLAEIDGVPNRQACMVPVAPGMRIARQRGARQARP